MVDKQLQIMVRESATPPSDRLNKIKEVIRNVSICKFHIKSFVQAHNITAYN